MNLQKIAQLGRLAAMTKMAGGPHESLAPPIAQSTWDSRTQAWYPTEDHLRQRPAFKSMLESGQGLKEKQEGDWTHRDKRRMESDAQFDRDFRRQERDQILEGERLAAYEMWQQERFEKNPNNSIKPSVVPSPDTGAGPDFQGVTPPAGTYGDFWSKQNVDIRTGQNRNAKLGPWKNTYKPNVPKPKPNVPKPASSDGQVQFK